MSFFDNIKQKTLRQTAEQKESSRQRWQIFTDNPLLFTALIVSGCLSHLSGWFIGLGVQVNAGLVSYTADLPHIFVACLYAALFPLFFEYGLANWLDKLLKREVGNKWQEFAAGAMVGVTGLGALLTAFSAADIIATTLGFFTSFTEIPPEVQRWMVFSLPVMLACNVLFGEVYRQNSLESILMRHAEMELREKRIEADMNVKLAQMNARADISTHAANQYAKDANSEAAQLGASKGSQKWQEDRKAHAAQPLTRQYAHNEPKLVQIVPTDKADTDFQTPPEE